MKNRKESFFVFLLAYFYYLLGTFACGKVTCPEEVLNAGIYGRFRFPETQALEHGNEVKVDCVYGFRNNGYESIYEEATSKVSNADSSGVRRSCFLVSSENDEDQWGEWRPNLYDMKVTKENFCKAVGWDTSIEKWNLALENVTPLTFQQLWASSVWIQIHAVDDYDCALALVNGFASLLTSPQLNGENGINQEERNQIFDRLERFISALSTSLPPGFKVQVGDGGIVVEAAKLYGTRYFARDMGTNHDFSNSRSKFVEGIRSYETKLKPLGFSDVFIDISAEAVHMAMQQSGTDPQVKITAYNQEIFKSWSAQGNENVSSLSSPSQICTPGKVTPIKNFNQGSRRNLKDMEEECMTLHGDSSTSKICENFTEPYETWGLLCIELHGTIQNLTEPVEFVISNESEVPHEHHLVCVYWDEEEMLQFGHDVSTFIEKVWSTDGVTTIEIENGVKCRSNHLTAFSALIEPLPLPFPGAEYAPINNSVHSYILSILSSIGSVLSIIGLFFTLLTFSMFKTLRRERSNRILINLSLSLLCLHLMSVSGSKSLWDDHCFVPAVSLHYLVLTSLAWMMVEAVHMFELLISVFVRPESRFLLKRMVIAWGMPFIIVCICAGVHPQSYYLGRADLCLMNAHENIILYYGAYIGPICLMLLVNMIIFVRIFRVFYQQTKRTTAAANQGKGTGGTVPKYYLIKISPSQIKGATSVLVLLGIGWVLGLLAMGPFEVLFRYMYCICNAGQGLLIFIFRVALNPQACKQWKKVIVGFSPDSFLDSSITTSSTTSGKQRKLQRKSTIMTPTFISASNSVENSLTASNPTSTTLANTLAAILKAENEKGTGQFDGIK